MIPSPQLKLDSINFWGEKTKPPAPDIPWFPLDAPSKKIVAKEELIQNDLNASTFPWKIQGRELSGLIQTDFFKPWGLKPNHVENAKGGKII